MFTATDIGELRGVKEDSMQDRCARLAYTPTEDEDEQETGVDHVLTDDVFACRFISATRRAAIVSTRDVRDAGVVVADSLLHLPLSADGVFDSRDRVRLTHRYEVALAAPLDLEIIGKPLVGATALTINVREVRT